MNKERFTKFCAETIGTFLLIFFGCGSIIACQANAQALPAFIIPIIFGLVVFAMVHALGHISGAHINPAVTLALASVKRFPLKDVPLYLLGQFLGACGAIAVLIYLFPESHTYGSTIPSVPVVKAFVWEFILTFALMFVIMAVSDTRAVSSMAGAAIGITVTLDAFIAGPLTGASMNPIRSIAPALFEGQFETLGIYISAPILGAIFAAQVYAFMNSAKSRKISKIRSAKQENRRPFVMEQKKLPVIR